MVWRAPIGDGAFGDTRQEVAQMTGPGGPGDGFPSIENLRELQLRALLNDLVKDLGPGKAAERLGVGRKTLWRWQQAAQLPPRLAGMLEQMLLERAVAAMEEEKERVNALEQRVAELEGQVGKALVAAGTAGDGNGGGEPGAALVKELRNEFSREIQRLERRLDRPGSGRGGPDADPGAVATAGRVRSERRYDDLVTREPAEDDEDVFGRVYPLISEWRALWVGHSPRGKGLAWALKRERILELELVMLEEHGLTLPPETAPLVGPERREQSSWRERELAKVRERRARLELLRWLRRALTLGLWRN